MALVTIFEILIKEKKGLIEFHSRSIFMIQNEYKGDLILKGKMPGRKVIIFSTLV